MKTSHTLPIAMAVALLHDSACTSTFRAGIDNSSSGGSGPAGGGAGAAGANAGVAPAVGGTAGAMLGRIPTNHRASDIQCAQPAPAGNCPVNYFCPTSLCSSDGGCADGGGSGDCITPAIPSTCSSDSDCSNAGPNGRCVEGGPLPTCGCSYDSCAGDSDCPRGQTCACHGSPYMFGSGNGCVPGNCQVDADCGTGGYCSPTPALPSNMSVYFQGVGYYCHTPKDECVDDSDCQGVGFPGCLYDQSAGFWKCEVYAQPA